jgi:YD repeat-containing protein
MRLGLRYDGLVSGGQSATGSNVDWDGGSAGFALTAVADAAAPSSVGAGGVLRWDGNTTTSSYDAAGELTSQAVPVSPTSSITTGYGYDAAGNPTSVTDGDGNTTRSMTRTGL